SGFEDSICLRILTPSIKNDEIFDKYILNNIEKIISILNKSKQNGIEAFEAIKSQKEKYEKDDRFNHLYEKLKSNFEEPDETEINENES
ncbi:MAG: hypothetical protein JXR31_04550, partial [Prolixibacteraceae bacterium]|nr:hypothetical protein [Prolixibacteraceae bacterium]